MSGVNGTEMNRHNLRKRAVDVLAGESQTLRSFMKPLYTGDRLNREVRKHRRKMLIMYLLVVAFIVAAAVLMVIRGLIGSSPITEVARPRAGEADLSIPVQVDGRFGDESVKGNAQINISPRHLTDEETDEALDKAAENISSMIPVDSEGRRVLTADVELPETDTETGAGIIWNSSDPVLISNEGHVDVLSLKGETEKVTMTAELTLNGKKRDVELEFTVTKNPEMFRSSISNSIHSVLDSLDENGGDDVVKLPEKLSNGVEVKWEKSDPSNGPALIICGLIILLGIYLSRYVMIRNKVKRYRESVAEDFPYILDKMILLLNSGLTVFSALMKISADCRDKGGDRPLDAEVAAIGERVRETNAPILDEWKAFAGRMESGEMLRFCSILEDSVSKGGEVTGKLERESDNMREMRRKNVQQHIRMVDSKMMLPMMMMMGALVMVTVTPAVFEI